VKSINEIVVRLAVALGVLAAFVAPVAVQAQQIEVVAKAAHAQEVPQPNGPTFPTGRDVTLTSRIFTIRHNAAPPPKPNTDPFCIWTSDGMICID
jgi:hypothetical protein